MNFEGVTHLFFDLDRTLWDFEKNSSETISELLYKHEVNVHHESFIHAYKHFNYLFWDRYQKGEINQKRLREIRFATAFSYHGIHDENLHRIFPEHYLDVCPTKPHVFPQTIETLQILKEKYPIYLVTNGFSEVQKVKIACSGIKQYVDGMITSDDTGYKKPHPTIFKHAMRVAEVSDPEKVLFIGDDLHADMMGADYIGMQTLFFSQKPERKWKNQVRSMEELCSLL